jgi:hypothetical protein
METITEQQVLSRVWSNIESELRLSRKQRLVRAITRVWPRLPQTFNGNQLALAVMFESNIHDVYYDTIFRYMREMKEGGVLDYEVENKQKSQYKKA